MLYRIAQLLVRTLWPLFGRLDVEGLDRIPDRGPFLLIANHQSYLDPVLIQTVIRRPVYTFTKSTQFSAPITGPLMRHMKSIPVRRFEIDPQAVRLALRHLESGDGVGIYIEGERTWDGRLQPPRLGTIRLILKAGVPVIPCGVSGAYDVWPRWGKLRRGTVRIRIGPALHFPRLDDRQARDAAVPQASRRLMDTVASLVDASQGTLEVPGEGRPERDEK